MPEITEEARQVKPMSGENGTVVHHLNISSENINSVEIRVDEAAEDMTVTAEFTNGETEDYEFDVADRLYRGVDRKSKRPVSPEIARVLLHVGYATEDF